MDLTAITRPPELMAMAALCGVRPVESKGHGPVADPAGKKGWPAIRHRTPGPPGEAIMTGLAEIVVTRQAAVAATGRAAVAATRRAEISVISWQELDVTD
jgi:hypothetical protein